LSATQTSDQLSACLTLTTWAPCFLSSTKSTNRAATTNATKTPQSHSGAMLSMKDLGLVLTNTPRSGRRHPLGGWAFPAVFQPRIDENAAPPMPRCVRGGGPITPLEGKRDCRRARQFLASRRLLACSGGLGVEARAVARRQR